MQMAPQELRQTKHVVVVGRQVRPRRPPTRNYFRPEPPRLGVDTNVDAELEADVGAGVKWPWRFNFPLPPAPSRPAKQVRSGPLSADINWPLVVFKEEP